MKHINLFKTTAFSLLLMAALISCNFSNGNDPETPTVTYEETDLKLAETDLGTDWTTSLSVPASAFSSFASGDYINVTTTASATAAEYWQICFANSSWENIASKETVSNASYSSEFKAYSLNAASQTTKFTPSDSDLATLKSGGLNIKGYGVKITKVTTNIKKTSSGTPSGDDSGTISADTCNKNANATTKRLYNYLKSIYGSKVLTGQMENAWNNNCNMLGRVYETTEKYPALMGFDFMNYTGYKYGDTQYQTDRAIKFWNGQDWNGNKISDNHGIIQFNWHWRDPLYTGTGAGEYAPDKISFRIPYNTSTDKWDTESDEYKAIISDLDVIAAELTKLQDAGVPVIWRPLHEGAGNLDGGWSGASAWFWWGAGNSTTANEDGSYTVSSDTSKCGECYIALWKLMYSYFTETKGLNNLIWLWNGQNSKFYPGDAYVDLIGDDIYDNTESTRYTSHKSAFTKFQNMGKTKMVAMSECGAFPSMTNIQKDKAWWLYFMVWNDGAQSGGSVTKDTDESNFWSGEFHNTDDHKKEVYASDIAITLDELPDLTKFE